MRLLFSRYLGDDSYSFQGSFELIINLVDVSEFFFFVVGGGEGGV